jgi:hypothetical protein
VAGELSLRSSSPRDQCSDGAFGQGGRVPADSRCTLWSALSVQRPHKGGHRNKPDQHRLARCSAMCCWGRNFQVPLERGAITRALAVSSAGAILMHNSGRLLYTNRIKAAQFIPICFASSALSHSCNIYLQSSRHGTHIRVSRSSECRCSRQQRSGVPTTAAVKWPMR